MTGRIRIRSIGVDEVLLENTLREAKNTPSRKMSASGEAWHSPQYASIEPFVNAAVLTTGVASPLRGVDWWKNVLYDGAFYREHGHSGEWAFVYHLTAGAPLIFEDRVIEAEPGQLVVFQSRLKHRTDVVSGGPRVSVAGNLTWPIRRTSR